MNKSPYDQEPFRQVADMEEPLTAVRDFLAGIAFIAETMSDDEGPVIQRIAWSARRELDSVMELRSQVLAGARRPVE